MLRPADQQPNEIFASVRGESPPNARTSRLSDEWQQWKGREDHQLRHLDPGLTRSELPSTCACQPNTSSIPLRTSSKLSATMQLAGEWRSCGPTQTLVRAVFGLMAQTLCSS